jgi:metallo-beta-lactamase family protein
MIMAGAGMCTGGRILHHFRHGLARPSTTVLFVGYQSQGSLGRMIADGKESVRIFGESIPVRASVHTMSGLSGHADQNGLLRWFDSMAPSKPRVILAHGEDRARQTLGGLIRERYQLKPEYPAMGAAIEA